MRYFLDYRLSERVNERKNLTVEHYSLICGRFCDEKRGTAHITLNLTCVCDLTNAD